MNELVKIFAPYIALGLFVVLGIIAVKLRLINKNEIKTAVDLIISFYRGQPDLKEDEQFKKTIVREVTATTRLKGEEASDLVNSVAKSDFGKNIQRKARKYIKKKLGGIL